MPREYRFLKLPLVGNFRVGEAYDALWITLYGADARKNADTKELSIALSRTLVGLAADGVTDPKDLSQPERPGVRKEAKAENLKS